MSSVSANTFPDFFKSLASLAKSNMLSPYFLRTKKSAKAKRAKIFNTLLAKQAKKTDISQRQRILNVKQGIIDREVKEKAKYEAKQKAWIAKDKANKQAYKQANKQANIDKNDKNEAVKSTPIVFTPIVFSEELTIKIAKYEAEQQAMIAKYEAEKQANIDKKQAEKQAEKQAKIDKKEAEKQAKIDCSKGRKKL